MTDTAAVAALFNAIDRVADSTGIPLEDGKAEATADFRSYGLGWFLSIEQGNKVVEHDGGFDHHAGSVADCGDGADGADFLDETSEHF